MTKLGLEGGTLASQSRALDGQGVECADKIILYFHGGGYTIGDTVSHGSMVARIAARNLPEPLACIAISPWGDLSMSGGSYSENEDSDIMPPKEWVTRCRDVYVGAANATDPNVSPVFGAFQDPPPRFNVVAGDELLASDSYSFRDLLEAAGGQVEFHAEFELPHVWTFFHTKCPPADKTIAQIGGFVRAQIAG